MQDKKMFALTSIAVAGVFGILVLGLWTLFPDLKSEVGAAWVQALGSILAIVGTWATTTYLFDLTVREQKRVQMENNRIYQIAGDNLCLLARSLVKESMNHAKHLQVSPGNPFLSTLRMRNIQESIAILEGKGIRASLYSKLLLHKSVLSAAIDLLDNPPADLAIRAKFVNARADIVLRDVDVLEKDEAGVFGVRDRKSEAEE